MEGLTDVRLLVVRQGVETTVPATVAPEQTLSDLVAKYFPDLSQNSTVKWLHCGRFLIERLPSTIRPGTVFHVYVRVLNLSLPIFRFIQDPPHAGHGTTIPPVNEFREPTSFDKILLSFLHITFVVVLSMIWNKFRSNPEIFDHISIFLMVAFSLITLVSAWNTYT
jgi:hypothetical protein